MSGMVWEFVGRLAHVSDPHRFKFWSAEECPAAHSVDLNLTRMEDVMTSEYGNSSTGGVSSDTPARPRSEWFSITSPASSVGSKEYLTLFSHLKLVSEVHDEPSLHMIAASTSLVHTTAAVLLLTLLSLSSQLV